MTEFIRVRFKDTGTEQTIAKPTAVDPDLMEVLEDDEATDYNLRPLAPVVKSAPSLEEQTVAELKAEIARRNEGRDEANLIPSTGNKPELIASIAADDNREGVQ